MGKPAGKRKKLTFWRSLVCTVVAIEHDGALYEVEADFMPWDKELALYRDGFLVQRRYNPGTFKLEDGSRIKVSLSWFGIKHAYLQLDGEKHSMRPIPGSTEYKRLRWTAKNPKTARIMGAVSWLTLVAAAIVGIPQLVEMISHIDPIADAGYAVTSPLQLSPLVNTIIGVGAVAGAVERGTRMKNSWLDSWAEL